MKISYNWLTNYLDSKLSAIEIATILTDTGLEVESTSAIGQVKGDLEGIVVGEVIECVQHPNADRLKITQVSIGTKQLQIVCGATNVAIGQKVAVALVGTTLYPSPDNPLTIKEAKIRGEESSGMLCAEDELGIGNSHDGILILEKDTPIGLPISEVIKLHPDVVFEIGLTPNRSDAMGHIGVARDLKAFLNHHRNSKLSITWPILKNYNVIDKQEVTVSITDPENCSRYCSAVIENVSVGESPEWLKIALQSIGLHPINNVVDVTNYVMHELGTPLHAFDKMALSGEIKVRPAIANESIVTLDGIERKLKGTELVIANAKEALCLAGVMGGQQAAVSNATTSLFLESAVFNAVSIRKTAKIHNLNTDASFRFERGVDPDLTFFALNRAIDLLLEVAGGHLIQGPQDVIIHTPKRKEFDIDIVQINKLIGIQLSAVAVEKILLDLDFQINTKNESCWTVTAPNYRTDVNRMADVAEEILRIIGFNSVPIPDKFHYAFTPPPIVTKNNCEKQISEFLVAKGFAEIMMNSLSKSSYSTFIPEDQEPVRIMNPLSSELSQMRQTLIFGLCETIVYNQNRQQSDLKLFEFGASYHKIKDAYVQTNQLALSISGKQEVESWNNAKKTSTIFTLKGTLYSLLARFNIFEIQESIIARQPFFSEGLSFSIQNQVIAEIGTLNQRLKSNFGIKNDVFIAIINWDLLFEFIQQKRTLFKELPKTFEVRRDFSLLLNETTNYQEIERIAYQSEKTLLKKVNLFDVYEGDKLENGKKSYAVSFHFQDIEKTLTDQVIDTCMERIRKNLEKELGANLR
jgi:phenylalanyl-tRNA synthetase beta chain